MSQGAKPCFSASDQPGKAFLPNGIYDYRLVVWPGSISIRGFDAGKKGMVPCCVEKV